jgi:hypothetical protein
MTQDNNGVFISYRRKNHTAAHSIRLHLEKNNYDVFMDVQNIKAGRFDLQIFEAINSRRHFLVILTPDSLERCTNADGSPNTTDWLRREIEHAIQTEKNVIPLRMEGFEFAGNSKYLTGSLEDLANFQSIKFDPEYYDYALERLLKFLETKPSDTTQSLPLSRIVYWSG